MSEEIQQPQVQPHQRQPMTVEEMKLAAQEIASRGYLVAIPGDLYAHLIDTIDVILKVSHMDQEARKVFLGILEGLRNGIPLTPKKS